MRKAAWQFRYRTYECDYEYGWIEAWRARAGHTLHTAQGAGQGERQFHGQDKVHGKGQNKGQRAGGANARRVTRVLRCEPGGTTPYRCVCHVLARAKGAAV
ncbi:hypothetical protein PSAC2689_110230 [Paraburkholderia sacchari]